LKRKALAITCFCLLLQGCFTEEPVPPESKLAEAQEFHLWRAGALQYVPDSFAHHRETLSKARYDLTRAASRFRWFRNYKPVQAQFAEVLKQGDELLKLLDAEKQKKGAKVLDRMESLGERLRQLDKLTLTVNEGALSRGSLTRTQVALIEARAFHRESRYIDSEEKLNEAEVYLAETEKTIVPLLGRYRDVDQLRKWKNWAKEAIQESREKKIYSILVIKADRELVLYSSGERLKTYRVGLGRRGWWDKQRAKDNATPEGRYRIVGKNPKSRYYKALLINYPNEQDRREFLNARKKGLLSGGVRIGGSIEIHGGGNEGTTYGCVALNNSQMEELYHLVGVGTPVTIVGAVDDRNSLSSALTVIENGRMEKEAP